MARPHPVFVLCPILFQSIAGNPDFEIEVMEPDENPIHFLIRYIPYLAVPQMVRRLNKDPSIRLRTSGEVTTVISILSSIMGR
ncbi:transposase [Algoriphagus resistens]|uniref:transposase n=1 Tax=Algoriphagus resistens TaxID=1750590 RepID=UPI0012F8128B